MRITLILEALFRLSSEGLVNYFQLFIYQLIVCWIGSLTVSLWHNLAE